ncbi:hypothetical protein PR202_gb26985 [Eleusine coracana subsp. coracana]|uniref:Uncharacterized protein n=1 Tax=Eleusine coracana subsp. coracana TaxID=191504 RepID=A0AAV5FTV7_ELECO|nr:hypothetical protein PR202_gb26985 [Eleusine coracana subsp. coracana]
MVWKGTAESKGGDYQVSWEIACSSKDEGGLGVHDLHTQNLCLLMKFLHKVVSNADAPWVRWIHQQYKPFQDGFEPSKTATSSWNTLAKLMPLYQAITSVDVGDGKSTFLWHDDWTTLGPLHQAMPALFSHCSAKSITVCAALGSRALSL